MYYSLSFYIFAHRTWATIAYITYLRINYPWIRGTWIGRTYWIEEFEVRTTIKEFSRSLPKQTISHRIESKLRSREEEMWLWLIDQTVSDSESAGIWQPAYESSEYTDLTNLSSVTVLSGKARSKQKNIETKIIRLFFLFKVTYHLILILQWYKII